MQSRGPIFESGPSIGTRKWRIAFSTFIVLVTWAFWPLFLRMAWASSDFRAHLGFAVDIVHTGRLPPHGFVFELLALAASAGSLDRGDLAVGAAIVATLAMAAKAALSARWLGRRLPAGSALVAALAALLAAPITWTSDHPIHPRQSAVYLGQVSGLVVQNPSTIVVFPFAILLFVASWRGRRGLAAALAAGQCVIKPSFVLAWMPAYLVLELWRQPSVRIGWRRALPVLTPCLAVLLWQFAFTDELGTGMSIAPFAAWSELTPDILASVVRSLAFPALLLAMDRGSGSHERELVFAWGVLGVALLQFSLLYIEGSDFSGNWCWGSFLAVYIVFLLSIERFAVRLRSRAPGTTFGQSAANAALSVVLVLHLASGLRYYWQALTVGRW